MVKDAEIHADEDKVKKEMAEIKNQADQLIYATEKSLNENGDKISESDKNEVKSAVESLKQVYQTDNKEGIKTEIEKVNKAAQKLAEAMYASQQAQAHTQQGTQQNAEEAPRGDDVVDADFEEIDKNK